LIHRLVKRKLMAQEKAEARKSGKATAAAGVVVVVVVVVVNIITRYPVAESNLSPSRVHRPELTGK